MKEAIAIIGVAEEERDGGSEQVVGDEAGG